MEAVAGVRVMFVRIGADCVADGLSVGGREFTPPPQLRNKSGNNIVSTSFTRFLIEAGRDFNNNGDTRNRRAEDLLGKPIFSGTRREKKSEGRKASYLKKLHGYA
jgi:hypothetical protein